jgi:hypothetical protein
MGNPNPPCTAEIHVLSIDDNKLNVHVVTPDCKTSTGYFYFTPILADGTLGKYQQSESWTAGDSQNSGDFNYPVNILSQGQVDSVTIDTASIVCSCLDKP